MKVIKSANQNILGHSWEEKKETITKSALHTYGYLYKSSFHDQ